MKLILLVVLFTSLFATQYWEIVVAPRPLMSPALKIENMTLTEFSVENSKTNATVIIGFKSPGCWKYKLYDGAMMVMEKSDSNCKKTYLPLVGK